MEISPWGCEDGRVGRTNATLDSTREVNVRWERGVPGNKIDGLLRLGFKSGSKADVEDRTRGGKLRYRGEARSEGFDERCKSGRSERCNSST